MRFTAQCAIKGGELLGGDTVLLHQGMADQELINTRVGQDTYSALQEYADEHDYSEYVATGQAVVAGLQSEGYLDGAAGVTTLQRISGEGVRFSAYAAAVLIGVMLTTPLPLSGAAVSLLVTALGFTAIWNAEPGVTEAIAALRERRRGAEPMTDGGGSDGE